METKNPNLFFYDSIAEDYNTLDSKDPLNKIIRKKVRDSFLQNSRGEIALDFGGGTGLDLEWLSKAFSTVYFCEPSGKMKSLAIQLNSEKIKGNRIHFIDSEQG